MEIIKGLYDTAKRKGQHNVILKLRDQIVEVMGVETIERPIDFVDRVIKDYNYYTQNI